MPLLLLRPIVFEAKGFHVIIIIFFSVVNGILDLKSRLGYFFFPSEYQMISLQNHMNYLCMFGKKRYIRSALSPDSLV